MSTIVISTIIVAIISIFFSAKYYFLQREEIYPNYEKRIRKSAKKACFQMAAGLIVANIITTLVAKPAPILAIVLAFVYFAFLIFLTINIKMWNEKVPVYDDNGKKIEGEFEEEPDKILAVKQLFSVFCLGIPMAVNTALAKAFLVGNNFTHPWKTIKELIWFFIFPLLALVVISIVQYLRIRGYFPRFAGWLSSDDEDDEPETPSNTQTTRTTDEYEDIYSNSRWYQRINWIYVGCAIGLAVVAIVCVIILINEFV